MVFSLVACVGYTLAYYFEWSLFQYYFAENSIGGFWEQGGASGPPILWYGWLATAVIAGGIAAMAIPKASAGLPESRRSGRSTSRRS
jgi:hypothetical protein